MDKEIYRSFKFSPWKILLIKGLNTVASTLNLVWKDILDNFSNLQNKENKFIHQLQIDPQPCKYFYRQFIDKDTVVVPVNIINKWSNEFDIEET